MKLHNIKWIFGFLSIILASSLSSCEEEKNNGPWETVSLDALITEAETLMANAVEGINAGDHKPGSITELQDVVTWVKWKKENSENQDEITDAAVKLQKYIDKFKTNIVALAIPWVKQSADTYIQISDNIKEVFKQPFTIEAECYIIDLNQLGYANNLFACEQDNPDSGFGVRYFGDGKVHIVVGNGGWTDTGDQSGTGVMKAGQWMHIALTNTGTRQVLYVDGVEVASQDASYTIAPDLPFCIGNGPKWTDRAVNSMIRDFRVWEGIRTADQIKTNTEVKGDEAGLKMFLPLQADLGTEFKDATGNYTAKFIGDIEWIENGTPPTIEITYDALNVAISNVETFKTTVTEGATDGSYPVGTIAYLDELIANANDVKANAKRQDQIDSEAEAIKAKIKTVKTMLVADSDGVLIDHDNSSAVGFRITPNYTPQGDYTVEFNVKVKSLSGYGTGEFFNNGEYGIWVYGYEELSEENVLKSGGLYNFTSSSDGWKGPKTDPLVIKTGTWQHVAIVHDEAAKTTKIYVDGVEKAVSTEMDAPNNSGWSEMWLGNGWGKMDGYIKDFRLWDVARPSAQLDADITGTEDGLQAYFPLSKVNGVKFDDVTGNYKGEMRGIDWNTSN